MKILIVHQYFKTPDEGSGIRTWYLAKAMVAAGHQVEVLTGHNQLQETIEVEGIQIHYQRIPYENRFGFLRRLWSFFLFVQVGKRFLKKRHDFGLLYVLTTPLSTGLIALHGKKKYGIPYVFEVGDLWPMAPVQMGMVPSHWLQHKLYHFEEKVYKSAKHLVALSPEIAKAMEYSVDYKQSVSVIPNMSDCEFFMPSADLPTQFDQENPFVINYCGAIGRANHLEYLLDLARLIDEKTLPIQIQIMGEGAAKERLQAASTTLKCVKWVKPGGKMEVRDVLSRSQAVYISYASYPVLETGSPNKLFDGLAAGMLIILNFGGWMKQLIEEHECGIAYDPKRPECCVELLSPFLQSPFLLSEYQKHARKLAEDQFEVGKLTARAVQLIES